MENDCVRFAQELKSFPKEIPQFSIVNFPLRNSSSNWGLGSCHPWYVISSKRQRVEKSTHLRDIRGQIDAKIPRFRSAPLGMTAFMVIENSAINGKLKCLVWGLAGVEKAALRKQSGLQFSVGSHQGIHQSLDRLQSFAGDFRALQQGLHQANHVGLMAERE